MPQCPIKQPAALLPHSGRMVLLDEVLSYDDNNLHAVCTIRPDCILLPDGANALPGWLGMEIMAQAIGAFAGIQALGAGEEVKLGFLLGTRKLNLFADHIPVGTTLAATAHLSTQDPSGMGVFDCELHWIDAPDDVRGMLPQDGLLAQAALNVYSPKNGKVV